jgi:hypothetical protein
VFHFFINSLYLPLALSVTDNKIIGEAADFAGIKQHNITGLQVTGRVNCFSGYFYSFQNSGLPGFDT